MKKLFFLTALLIVALTLISLGQYQDGIKILDPSRGNWTKTAANFDSIKVKITPAGIYANVDIELNVSGKNTQFASFNDSLEIEYKFTLPEGCFIHDAWLWMDNIPVQATLYERKEAQTIYEALVNRRIDPLIIYKNDNSSYEARIFPVLGSEPRKALLSILMPINANSNAIDLPLLLSMFRTDINNTIPIINFEVVNNTTWGVPQVWQAANNVTTVGNSTHFSLNATKSNIDNIANLYFPNYNKEGLFMVQETAPLEGYFQMILPINDSLVKPQNLLFALDCKLNADYFTVLQSLKNKIAHELTIKDSFNIAYNSQDQIMMASNHWVPADTNSINSLYSNILLSAPGSNKNSEIILKAIQFNNEQNNKGKILVLTNNNSQYFSVAACNAKVAQLIDSMQQPMAINVLHLGSEKAYDFNVGSQYYYNNYYLLSNLTTATGGFYADRYVTPIDYYSQGEYKSINNVFATAFQHLLPTTIFDFVSYSYDGFLANEFNIPYAINTSQRNAYMAVGKYFSGGDSISITRAFKVDTTISEITYNLLRAQDNNNLTKKMWGGNFINELGKNNTGSYTMEIIDNSLDYNILSTKTAFLALEPDTIMYKLMDVPPVAVNTPESNKTLSVNVAPNPFTDIQNISFELTAEMYGKSWELEIRDISGKRILSKSGIVPNQKKLTLQWNATGLPTGVYLINVKIGSRYSSIKVSKK